MPTTLDTRTLLVQHTDLVKDHESMASPPSYGTHTRNIEGCRDGSHKYQSKADDPALVGYDTAN